MRNQRGNELQILADMGLLIPTLEEIKMTDKDAALVNRIVFFYLDCAVLLLIRAGQNSPFL